MKINSIETLHNAIASGEEINYLYFWGHRHSGGKIRKTCFSQWYQAEFCLDNVTYLTAEHYMMAEKARLFKDQFSWERIIGVDNPGEAKKLGRKVKGFQEDIWRNNRFAIVVRGNIAKFDQNPLLKEFLLATNDNVLVEASPYDRIWGVGLGAKSPQILDPWQWKGLNLLGFALMEARSKLKENK